MRRPSRWTVPGLVVMAVLAASWSACNFRRGPDPVATTGAQTKTCHDTKCTVGCDAGVCDFDCTSSTECNATCSGAATCGVVSCHDDTVCNVGCSEGSSCNYIDCRGATTCKPSCTGGSRCNVNCDGVTDCEVRCTEGSPCLVLCSDPACSPHTTFRCTSVDGGTGAAFMSCPGGVMVCSRACPTCGDGICDRVAGETCNSCPQDCKSC